MFLPHSRVVAVVLSLVLPEVVSHVWKSPSVIQRTIKKLHCGFQNTRTSLLFPPRSDLNQLVIWFLSPPSYFFSLCLISEANTYQLKIQLLPDKAEKFLWLFRWLGDQGFLQAAGTIWSNKSLLAGRKKIHGSPKYSTYPVHNKHENSQEQ